MDELFLMPRENSGDEKGSVSAPRPSRVTLDSARHPPVTPVEQRGPGPGAGRSGREAAAGGMWVLGWSFCVRSPLLLLCLLLVSLETGASRLAHPGLRPDVVCGGDSAVLPPWPLPLSASRCPVRPSGARPCQARPASARGRACG